MRRVQGDGVELAVADEGEGPPVLLIHGFPDSSRLWRHQVRALVDAGFRAIAPDLRGFGDSDRPAEVEAYRIRHSVADMVAVLDALEVERAHVVCHDWGAAVGWGLAGLEGERVDRFASLSVGHPNMGRWPSLEQREKGWYTLLFQFEGVAEELLQRDDWRLFREWSRGDGDGDRHVADLARPGALTAGLNWYRANARPESAAARAPAVPVRRGGHARAVERPRPLPGRGGRGRVRRSTSSATGATSGSRARATGCSSTRPTA